MQSSMCCFYSVGSAGFYTGVDLMIRHMEIDRVKILLKIWDTAGQERFKSIGKGYYRKSEVACSVCV